MTELTSLNFERLDLSGLRTLVDWAAAEGWNPGPFDAEAFWAADPEGFYGFYDQSGLVAGGAIVSYDSAFGFMGLFIVRPDLRGQGMGRRLWHLRRDALLARLQPGAAIGMDGVVAMQSFYSKGGFQIAFRDERYERLGVSCSAHPNVLPVQPQDFSELLAYDSLCFGVPRARFLRPWLELPQRVTFKYCDARGLRGYAVLRKAQDGHKIGPLFADDAEIARALYTACLNAVPGESVFLDIPVNNANAVALVRDYEASYVFECARMYHGKPPAAHLERVFGITTFELG